MVFVFFFLSSLSFFYFGGSGNVLFWIWSQFRYVVVTWSSVLFLFQSERIEKGQGTWRHTAASLSNVTLLLRLFSFLFLAETCNNTRTHTIPLQFRGDQLQDFNRNVLVIAFALSWTTFNLISKTPWNSVFCWITGKTRHHEGSKEASSSWEEAVFLLT